MADYKVGNLQIVFDTLNQTDEGFKKLASNLRSVQKAIAKIGDTDLKPFVANIKQITASFTPLLADINGASGALKDFNELTKQLGIKNVSNVATEFQKLNKEEEETSNAVAELTGEFEENKTVLQGTKNIVKDIWSTFSNDTIQSTLDLQKQEQQILRNKIAFLELKLQENDTEFSSAELRKELKKLKKELGNTQKDTKKSTSALAKLFNAVKRIALYRILRTVLKEISQSFTETVKAFAQVDDGVNDTMSKLTSSLNIIKLSFGATLLPILQIITPIIQQIGLAFANVANMVSQAMSTTGTYTKINTDLIKNYREELEKTGSLVDFDKIRSLSTTSGGLSDFLIPDQAVDESNEKLEGIRETFAKLEKIMTSVFDVVKDIGQPVFEALLDVFDALLVVVPPVLKEISRFVTELSEAGLLKPIIIGITAALLGMGAVKVIKSIKDVASTIKTLNLETLAFSAAIGFLIYAIANFVGSFNEISGAAKVLIPIISLLTGAFAALAVSKAAAAAGIAAPATALLTAGAIAAAIAMVAGTAIAKNANRSSASSVPDSGVVARASSSGIGSAGYLNNTQNSGQETVSTEQSMYNALVRYNRENRSDNTAINVNIDGQKVFEAVQRTANRKGLGFSRV